VGTKGAKKMCQYIGLPGAPEQDKVSGTKTKIMCPCCASDGEENKLCLIPSSEIYFCPVCGEYFNDKNEILDVALDALLARGLEK
jgi:hypothetical protein